MTKMIAIDRAASASLQRISKSRSASVMLRRFAWFVLVYNVLVILWGGVVRATGSGAGCGDQWPLCDGAAIPQSPQFHTLIEFTHRLMSGGALVLIVALLVWTWRATAKGHLARWTAVIALVLVMNEAFLGALLVTVAAHSASVATGVLLFSCHLTNTLLLVAALALTADFLVNPRFSATTHLRPRQLVFPTLGILATLLVGVTGSLVALGDTMYPSSNLLDAIRQDFSATAPLLLRLRWIHPASALVAGAFILWLLVRAFRRNAPAKMHTLGMAVLVTLLLQYLLGVFDVVGQQPTWLQILHLLGANVFWIFLVLLTANYCLVDKSPDEALRDDSSSAKRIDPSF
ncbi:MAG TPA: COX15/CtaA family protein [Acidobacteriaceae bacterium]|nr:COX15/CtaA family protein [Acidobacteriaceae bacterium]